MASDASGPILRWIETVRNERDQPLVRLAEISDLDSIVRFHVRIWRETYRDLAPEDAILKLDHDYRRPFWQKHLTAPERGSRPISRPSAGILLAS